MKRTKSGRVVENGKKLPKCSFTKYTKQYVDNTEDPTMGIPELQTLKSNTALNEYIDVLTYENSFMMLKKIKNMILTEFNIEVSISFISKLRTKRLHYKRNRVSQIARKRLEDLPMNQLTDCQQEAMKLLEEIQRINSRQNLQNLFSGSPALHEAFVVCAKYGNDEWVTLQNLDKTCNGSETELCLKKNLVRRLSPITPLIVIIHKVFLKRKVVSFSDDLNNAVSMAMQNFEQHEECY